MISLVQIASRNLLRKKARTALTLAGISLSAWVLVSLFGFNRGYERALNRDIGSMGYEFMVMAKGCPYEAATLMLQGGTGLRYMEEETVRAVAREPEVDRITPILMQAYFDPNKGENGGIAGFFGVQVATYAPMKPFFRFREGGWFAGDDAGEVVMGFEAAELEHRMDHRPGQISGGEMQRVAIARALVNRPRILLADEPTGSLDTARTAEIGEVLQHLNRSEGLTVVMVTHNPALAGLGGRHIEMRDGLAFEA